MAEFVLENLPEGSAPSELVNLPEGSAQAEPPESSPLWAALGLPAHGGTLGALQHSLEARMQRWRRADRRHYAAHPEASKSYRRAWEGVAAVAGGRDVAWRDASKSLASADVASADVASADVASADAATVNSRGLKPTPQARHPNPPV